MLAAPPPVIEYFARGAIAGTPPHVREFNVPTNVAIQAENACCRSLGTYTVPTKHVLPTLICSRKLPDIMVRRARLWASLCAPNCSVAWKCFSSRYVQGSRLVHGDPSRERMRQIMRAHLFPVHEGYAVLPAIPLLHVAGRDRTAHPLK